MSEPRAIWKFPIKVHDSPVVEMPKDAQLLHFGVQDDQPMLWALVQPGNLLENRLFRLYGTGHPVAETGFDYFGTCFHGPFVWHLFTRLS